MVGGSAYGKPLSDVRLRACIRLWSPCNAREILDSTGNVLPFQVTTDLGESVRIIAAIPLPYAEKGGFWNRDLGLVVLALRAAGHDATFVALNGEADSSGEKPLRLASRETM